MPGYIYIASAFETVNRSSCGQAGSWIDNDPHFWTDPPTWGICRPDLRAGASEQDVVYFVLPKHGQHPQMIFAYLTIKEIITHAEAFWRPELLSKRMGTRHRTETSSLMREVSTTNSMRESILKISTELSSVTPSESRLRHGCYQLDKSNDLPHRSSNNFVLSSGSRHERC